MTIIVGLYLFIKVNKSLKINSLIITRVLPNWTNSGGYVMSYDNISPNSIEATGIYGGVNNQLIPDGYCASAVIAGQSQRGLAGDAEGSVPGDVLAQVRAKFHGGSTGGFDTKFLPAFKQQTEDLDMCGLVDEFGETVSNYRCYNGPGIFQYIPGACGHFEGAYGMGGMCPASDCPNDGDYHSYFEPLWGEVQTTSSPGGTSYYHDWNGIGYYAQPMDIVHADQNIGGSPPTWVDDDTDAFLNDQLAQQCRAGVPRGRVDSVCRQGVDQPGRPSGRSRQQLRDR